MRPVLYDVLRLFIGPGSVVPRGIDRVDLAYALHLFEHSPRDVWGVMPTPWGVRLYERTLVRRGLARLQALWQEAPATADGDPGLAWVRARLAGADAPWPAQARRAPAWRRQWALVRETGLPWGRPARQAPRGSLYLNVGQLGWAAPMAMGWLRDRPDVAPVVMLHDAIALETPHWMSRFNAASQRAMLRMSARHATGLITNSVHARDSVTRALARHGGAVARQLTLPLPLADGFVAEDAPDPALAQVPYYVICGAIEPRKNHALLLRLWPRVSGAWLVIAGLPAHGAQPVLAAARQPRVLHAPGLSTAALRVLMRHARALLMPSLAEGFGLPVQEALSLGVPVIASDIGPHREVAQGQATLLPASDEGAWLQALLAPPQAPRHYRPQGSAAYFAAVDAFLDGF